MIYPSGIDELAKPVDRCGRLDSPHQLWVKSVRKLWFLQFYFLLIGLIFSFMDNTLPKDQQHPRAQQDRTVVDQLLKRTTEPTDLDLVELARLLIRYEGFPGARELQQDLRRLLQQWRLAPEELFAKTREIHQQGTVYKPEKIQAEDWS